MENKTNERTKTRYVAVAVATLVLFVLAASSLVMIPSGHTGVVTRFGAIRDVQLEAGLHWKTPFVDHVTDIDNHILKVEMPFSSVSKDFQTMRGSIAVNYRIRPGSSAGVYQKFDQKVEEILVNPAVCACVNAVVAHYTAEELCARLQSVGDKMKDLIQQKLEPYGLDVETLWLTNFSLPEGFAPADWKSQADAVAAQRQLVRQQDELEQECNQTNRTSELQKSALSLSEGSGFLENGDAPIAE